VEDRARPLDVDGLPGGSAAPQAVTEQPDLAFEHHPESKWLGDVLGLRLLAVGLTWRLRRRDGRAPAVPWGPLVATAALAAVAAGLLALGLARLLA
jgi:hypothetical protein